MRSRIFISLLAGTIGGFIGWFLQENLIHYQAVRDVLTGACSVVPLTASEGRTLIFCIGGMPGLFLGAVDGIVEGNSRKLIQGMLIGALAGIVLGYVGLNLGSWAYNALGGNPNMAASPSPFEFVHQLIARSFGWTFMGLGLGVGASISTRSPKRIRNGAIGGLLGGLIGGFIFNLISLGAQPMQAAMGAPACADAGGPSRMIGFTAIGGLTGLFIGLVEELLKQAWVKVLAGHNEGKDFILSKAMSILGRDERCDVPLYGDPTVGVQHAAIRADGHRHVLLDANTPAGTVVNGQRVAPGGEQLLRDGDMIQIGSHRILFREKATANKYARAPVDLPKSGSPVAATPMPAHLCPFCGAPRDAAGNCLCTTAGSPAAPVGGVPVGQNVPAGYGGNVNMGAGAGGYGTSGVSYGGYGAPASGGASVPGGVSGMARLVGVEGPYAGQVFLLTAENTVIGREPDKDVVLSADTTVSRNHARITNEGGDYVVYDAGSSNGTFVNNLRVSMHVLTPGDIVQFGASKFRYE